MARKPKPKTPTQPPQEPSKGFDDDVDDGESLDEEVTVDPADVAAAAKSRDWRDVERYREMRELRKLVGDDIDMDDDLDRPRRRS